MIRRNKYLSTNFSIICRRRWLGNDYLGSMQTPDNLNLTVLPWKSMSLYPDSETVFWSTVSSLSWPVSLFFERMPKRLGLVRLVPVKTLVAKVLSFISYCFDPVTRMKILFPIVSISSITLAEGNSLSSSAGMMPLISQGILKFSAFADNESKVTIAQENAFTKYLKIFLSTSTDFC